MLAKLRPDQSYFNQVPPRPRTGHATHHRWRIDDATLEDVIEEGELKRRDELNLWVFKHIHGRADNLICAAVVEETSVMVKTVMINWELEDEA
ncbi:MAG: hypothetical protein Q8O37_14015 [Sulfuricellaceae bacterium]|nr:hypothetical protein [Sulfuricellaceae bacterium]